jgi:biotin carboxyl carrier protein
VLKIKAPVVLALLLSGSVIVTFVFWRQVSFGRRLDDAELAEVLTAASPSRRALHGIEELTRRAGEGRPGMDRWNERLVAVSSRPETNLRRAAAWAMQVSARDPAVAARLLDLARTDPDATVRRNAACSLTLSADPSAARPVLRSMLAPFVVAAPAAGTVESLVPVGRRPREDEMVGRLRGEDGARVEISTPVPGRVTAFRVREGDRIAAGAPVAEVAPGEEHVLNAAKGLAFAGTADDVDLLRAFLVPGGDVTPAMADQCRRAIAEIERRAAR